VISPAQKHLPNKRRSQGTEFQNIGGIRTRNPSKPAATDPHFRMHGHSDGSNSEITFCKYGCVLLLRQLVTGFVLRRSGTGIYFVDGKF